MTGCAQKTRAFNRSNDYTHLYSADYSGTPSSMASASNFEQLMKKNTQWMLVITGCVTFMLACFCAETQPEEEPDQYTIEEYTVTFGKEDGGNTDKGYYVVSPMPRLPIVVGSRQAYTIRNWEDSAFYDVSSLEIKIDPRLGDNEVLEPTEEGLYTIGIEGQAFSSNVDRKDELIADEFAVKVVKAQKTIVDGHCASKDLAKGMAQFISVRFAYDDQENTLAYGQGYYPLSYIPSEVHIQTITGTKRDKVFMHTISDMHVTISEDVGETITMYDRLDDRRPIVFKTTESKTLTGGQIIALEEYDTRLTNPSDRRLLLQAKLDDGSQICPHDYQLRSKTPEVCRIFEKANYFYEISDDWTMYDEARKVIHRKWFLNGLQAGQCILEATIDGFEGTVSTTFDIDARPERTSETRLRKVLVPKPSRSGGSGGGSGFDYD